VIPGQVTFTPANWNIGQEVAVKGLNDCVVDGTSQFRVSSARAISNDIEYAGLQGGSVAYTNADDDSPTNSTTLLMCNLTLVSSKQVTLREFDYIMRVDLTNLGPDVGGIAATVTSSAVHTRIMEGSLTFGPLAQGATATSQDTFTIRQNRTVPFDPAKLDWTLTPLP
jgi:hypothetical protein